MQLSRLLEPEVMDTEEDALEYDAIDNRFVNAEFVRYLTSELSFSGGRVLDLGTGPADIAIAIAEAVPNAEVVAVDLGTHMLELAARKVSESFAADRIELAQADAKATGFPEASFDFVICNSLVHHVPDPLALFQEIARVARPGAGIFVKDLKRPATIEELEELVATHAARDTKYQRTLFYNSLHAALLPSEVAEFARAARLSDASLEVPSDRHWQLARAMTPETESAEKRQP